MNIKIFLKECSKREVFKLLSIYIVSGWVILQVLSVIAEPLGLPKQSIPLLILLLIIGFPLYIIYIWNSRLSGSWKSDEDDSSSELLDKSKFRQMYFTSLGIILFLSGLSVVIIINNTFGNGFSLPEMVSNDKIAVLKFGNNTGDEKLDIIGKMTEDWIMHGITENKAGQIISQDVVKDYTEVIKTQKLNLTANEILNNYFKPGKKITGSYFLNGNQLIFKCSVKNGLNEETLIALESVVCNSNSPLDCIEELKQKIVGYLVTAKSGTKSLEKLPPKYEAYKAMLEAKASNRARDNDKYLELLDKAIALDSSFFEPKSLKVGYYYNYGDYAKADSLIVTIKENTGITERQQYLLSMYEAALHGDNDKVYRYNGNEYSISPFDLDTNLSQMVIALQFVNQPKDLEAIFDVISFDNFKLENCQPCADRIYMMAIAHNEMKNYSKAIELLEPYVDIIDDIYFLRIIMSAYIKSNNKVKADDLLDRLKLRINAENWLSLNLFISRQFLLVGDNKSSKSYLDTIVKTDNNKDNLTLMAETYYEIGDYVKAENIYSKLITVSSTDSKIITNLSKCHFKNGKPNEGKRLMDSLEQLRGPYQYGEIDYRIAEIYAAQNDENNTFIYLLKSIAAGNFYTDQNFKNDTNFILFKNSEKWNEIMSYWH